MSNGKQMSIFDFESDSSDEQNKNANELFVASHPEEIVVQDEVVDITEAQERDFDSTTTAAKLSTGQKSETRGRQRVEEFDKQEINVPEDGELFKKNYYGIGEVANMFNANISMIRFWENNFPILKPKKNAKGDRLFRPEDIKNLKLIHHLLRDRKFTIEGAKEHIRLNKMNEEKFEIIENLKKLKQFLQELKIGL